MKILVTGAAGFLGFHLCRRLLKDGHEVVGIDNYYSGSRPNVSILSKYPRFSFVEQDVVNPYDIPCDQIFNLACPASPPHYQRDPIYTLKISVLGAINALENGLRHKARVFQASTSEIYGDPEIHPQPESYCGHVNPIGIRSCYDEGKRAAETLFADYARTKGSDIRVARIFNTYGPNMRKDDGRVITNFLVQALEGKNLTVYGEGQQTRSFCYCDDLIEGFVRLMAHSSDIGPVNLGNPGEFTILELAEKVNQLVGGSSQLVYLPLPGDDPRQRRPDITKATMHLGWKPSVSLDIGLERTLSYYRTKPL
jgi:UDP-glucuronate decarboxylase